MKNSLIIIILMLSLCGCSTIAATDIGDRKLLRFADLATEIKVRYEDVSHLPPDEQAASVAMLAEHH